MHPECEKLICTAHATLNTQASGKPVLQVNRKGIKVGHLFLLVTALKIQDNNQIVKSEKDETCYISKPLIWCQKWVAHIWQLTL